MFNRTRNTVFKAVGIALLVLVVYVFCSGPAAYLATRGIGVSANEVVYWPLGWVCQKSDALKLAYFKWLTLWSYKLPG